MEFEDQEEQDEEMGLATSYDSLDHLSHVKMVNSEAVPEAHLPRKPRYRECLKNHAVGIGGHAVDGCGEFIAAGEEGTLDALKCAACTCHRNFHRKETTECSATVEPLFTGEIYFHHPHGHLHSPSQVPQFSPYYRSPAGYLHMAAVAQHRPLTLPSTSGGGGTHSRDREDQEDMSNLGGGSRKRFRTKFTQEQKDKMLEFAEKLGWRINKHDEEMVQRFCEETGVKRHVLKVWMHNNKNTLALDSKEGNHHLETGIL
ncbi:zinc-finger homeodomain protein 1-like [Mangifera indica]|uniref:zinc-finger homeodomain protein 1-like n=1 Tax=Mangifera indica TaxID=29780 RepID=UPI001CFAE0A3|nr:zinc-finger homeodomain protein 1-like [Mangifera indica]